MKKILTFSVSVVAAFALVFGIATLVSQSTAYAHDGENHTAAAETNQSEKKEEVTADKANAYNYVAQTDDTYSQMARKAIQTYGVVNKVNLSQAQIVAAETNLTITAGSPVLLEGQKVSIDQSAVKAEVEKAQKLSKDQQAAWQAYTVGVNFNTNAVGQAK